MKNFILSAAVLALAGASLAQANVSNSNLALQDTTKKDTVTTPADTTKKDTVSKEIAYGYAGEQDTTTTQQAPMATEQPAAQPATAEKKEVKLDELPEAVKNTLTADVFKEWVPSTAHMMAENGTEVYEIEVKKGEEMRSIKIGADGKVVQ